MWFLFDLFIYAIACFVFTACVITAFLATLSLNVGKNKVMDNIKITILVIIIGSLFALGSYMDISFDFEPREGSDYFVPCYLYFISIISALTLFPSIPKFKITSYVLILSFTVESILRLKSHCSLIQCYWIFKHYLPSTLEEELKYTPADECSYFILIFSSICILCMLYLDWRQNKICLFKSLPLVAIFVVLIFLPINIYRCFNYYIPSNYNVNNSILRNSDIELLIDNIRENVSEENLSSIGNITLGESSQTVDREIRKYIKSVEKDSIAYIFDNETFIRSISCILDDNKVQVISYRLENCNHVDTHVKEHFGCKFVGNREYALVKTGEFVRLGFNQDINGVFDYLYKTRSYETSNWISAINIIPQIRK